MTASARPSGYTYVVDEPLLRSKVHSEAHKRVYLNSSIAIYFTIRRATRHLNVLTA